MTFSSNLAHTDPIYKDLAILLFEKIFIDRIGITMFKLEYELPPKAVIQILSKNRDVHSHCKFFKDNNCYKDFTYLSVRIWNAIVSKININLSLSQFKYIKSLLIA